MDSYGIYVQPPTLGSPELTPHQRQNIIATITATLAPAPQEKHGIHARSGDDWTIIVNFVDAAGKPVDMTHAQITWTLLDWTATVAIPSSASLWMVAADGTQSLTLPHVATVQLDPGAYLLFIRATFSDGNIIYSTGARRVLVGANPFNT